MPSNTYGPTVDGKEVVIGGNSDTLFKRLMGTIGRSDIGESEEYNDNQKRVEHQTFLDGLINDWVAANESSTILDALNQSAVPNGLIYSIKDIATDPQYLHRNMIESVHVPELDRELKIPGISPKLNKTPGKTKFAGPKLGEHSMYVLKEVMGLSAEEIEQHIANKVVVV